MRKILLTVFAVFASVSAVLLVSAQQEFNVNIPEMWLKLDYSTIFENYKIRGVDFCLKGGKPRACLIVQNPYPANLIVLSQRVTPEKYDDIIFFDAKVYQSVPLLPLPRKLFAVPNGLPYMLAYNSKIDPAWHSEIFDNLVSAGDIEQAGKWGKVMPATGYVVESDFAPLLPLFRSVRAASGALRAHTYLYKTYGIYTNSFVQQMLPQDDDSVRVGKEFTPKTPGYGKFVFYHFPVFESCNPCWGPRVVKK